MSTASPAAGVYQDYNQPTQQAPQSSFNPSSKAIDVQMMILVELQVISFLLSQAGTAQEDLSQLRRDIAASIYQ